MTTIQEQYTEIVKQGSEATLSAVDAWSKAVQEAFIQVLAIPLPAALNQVADQVHDFAEQLLDAQRDVAKKVVDAAVLVPEAVRAGAAQATGATQA